MKPLVLENLRSNSLALFLVNQSPGDLRLLEIVCQDSLAFREVYAYHDPEDFIQDFFAWYDETGDAGEPQALILLDSGLPLEGAQYLMDRLRTHFSPGKLPVVLLASALYPSSNYSVPYGVNEVLELPCSLPELEATLGQVIGAYRA